MLHCAVMNGKCTIGIAGDIMDIQTDTCMLVKHIHKSLLEVGEKEGMGTFLADLYRDFVKEALYNLTLADETEQKAFGEDMLKKAEEVSAFGEDMLKKAEEVSDKLKKELREADN